MKALFSFRLALLLAALLVLLAACTAPETPTEPSADTTPTVDRLAQLIADNGTAIKELTDTDQPVLLHSAGKDAGAADAFAAQVGAAGVAISDVEGFSCRDLAEQTLRVISVDQDRLDQTQIDSLVDALAATP